MSCPLHHRSTRRRFAAVFALLGLLATASQASTDGDWSALGDGSIVLFRHANAPGGGDPAGFQLGNCRTQRTLDDTGRAQARRIGEQFRRRGVKVGAVLTSQWCRTRETAELAFPGQWRDEPAFNSFFGDRSQADARTAAALAVLDRWRGPGVLVVSTHQMNIIALTGIGAASAEGVVVRSGPAGFEVLTRLRFD